MHNMDNRIMIEHKPCQIKNYNCSNPVGDKNMKLNRNSYSSEITIELHCVEQRTQIEVKTQRLSFLLCLKIHRLYNIKCTDITRM